MNLAMRLKLAKQKAEAFLRDEGIADLAVDPFAIAARRDIEVRAKPSAVEGVSGMLLRHGDMFGIYYSTHIPSEGFQRFSVAHELGHYFLEGHIDHILPAGGIHKSRAGFVSSDPYEMEADHFAAGLLMPSVLFRKEINRRKPGLATIDHLSGRCKTSLTATAIRFAELSDDAVAVIISTAAGQGKRMNACSCALADEALEVDRVPPRALPAVLERGCGLGLVQQVQGHVPDHGHVLRRMAGAQA